MCGVLPPYTGRLVMKNFVKVVNPGKVKVGERLREVFVEIDYRPDGELLLHGVVGPWHSGNCAGSFGQIVDELEEISVFHKGWSKEKVRKLRQVWYDWHLNYLRPVCVHQAKWDTTKMIALENGEQRMAGWVRQEEHPEGLLGKPCPVCGYKYGSAWNKEEVPEDALAWLYDLPDTKITPAWV
jgi:hypothetical protein